MPLSPTEPHAGMLTGLFGRLFFFFFRFSCLIVQRVLCCVSTLLFIPCDPLNTDSLVGVLPTSPPPPPQKKEKIGWLGGKKRRSSHLQCLSQEFGNMTPAKAFRGLVSNVVIFGWLENKAGWGVDKVPEWLWQEGGGSVGRGSGLGLGQPAAGLAPGLTRETGNLAEENFTFPPSTSLPYRGKGDVNISLRVPQRQLGTPFLPNILGNKPQLSLKPLPLEWTYFY